MSILPDSRYEKIHTGSAIETQRLKSILEENNIPSILRDDNESAKLAGYALGSPNQTRLLVDKEHLVRAKHLVASTLEDFDHNRISDSDLDTLAQQKPVHEKVITKNTRLHPKAPKMSKGFLLFYFAYIPYAIWRLYPMITGAEELNWLRIAVSGGLGIFCVYRIAKYFTPSS